LGANLNNGAKNRTNRYLEYREPEFLIIGAQKCGTSSLYHNLCQHPHIRSARQKEIHFFDDHYDKGLNWYRSHFPPVKLFENILTGEASPYYLFHPYAPKRASLSHPRINLIILLRNPVDRAYSHYHHNIRKGREKRSFEEAVAEEIKLMPTEVDNLTRNPAYNSHIHKHFSYLSRGGYIHQIEAWLKHYPINQFLFLKSEEFFKYPEVTINAVYSFLGVEQVPVYNFATKNKYSYPPMNRAIRQNLVNFFKPHNDRLSKLLGPDFCWREAES
jgi:hypothetical protein